MSTIDGSTWRKTDFRRSARAMLEGTGYGPGRCGPISRHTHSDVARIFLRPKKNRKDLRPKEMVVKRIVAARKNPGPLEKRLRSTWRQFTDEREAYNDIHLIMGKDFVPESYGSEETGPAIGIEHLKSPSLGGMLTTASNPDDRNSLIREVIHAAARFDGTATRHKDRFFEVRPRYHHQADEHSSSEHGVLAERLSRANFPNAPTVSSQNVDDLVQLDQKFNLRKILAHGEFNPDHVYRVRINIGEIRYLVLDPTTLGSHTIAKDIGDSLIHLRLGGNALFKDTNSLAKRLELYLALEHAYENGEDEVVPEILSSDASVGKYMSDVVKMEDQQFAEFSLGFYAAAARKLAFLGSRQGNKDYRETGRCLEEVYLALIDNDTLFEHAENTAELRQYFNRLGQMFNESGLTRIPGEVLRKIVSPSNGLTRTAMSYAPAK